MRIIWCVYSFDLLVTMIIKPGIERAMTTLGPVIQGAQNQPRSWIPKVRVRLRGRTRWQDGLEG